MLKKRVSAKINYHALQNLFATEESQKAEIKSLPFDEEDPRARDEPYEYEDYVEEY